jgi:hypothetical protein
MGVDLLKWNLKEKKVRVWADSSVTAGLHGPVASSSERDKEALNSI